MSRVPELERYQLSKRQTAVYDEILASRGSLDGPFRAWLHSPELADRAQKLGEVVRFQTSLPERLSELAILVTARFYDAQIEWSIHEPIARRAGVPQRTIEALRSRREPNFDSPDDEAIYHYVDELLTKRFVADKRFAAVQERIGARGITELTILVGYYSLVAMSLNALEVAVPVGLKPLLPDAPAPSAS